MLANDYYYSADLPWTIPEEEQERFRRIFKRSLLVFLLFGLLLPLLPVPTIERQAMEAVPPRLAKLILERQEMKPPAAPVKAPEAEPVQARPEPKKLEPKPVIKNVETARKKAERSGLLAFKDDLADLRDNSVAAGLKNTRLTQGAGTSARVPERAMVTSNLAGGSGGINTARLSRDTGGGGLAGRVTTKVSSPIGSGGGDGVRRGGGGQAARSVEEIKLIFDKNKAAIYALYNRALREDPTLQGKVILKLTIAPSGLVMACEVVSSELRATDLERKLVSRVRLFDFGAKNVGVMVVTYPIDFLPS
jgi:periplasmic protein TonB